MIRRLVAVAALTLAPALATAQRAIDLEIGAKAPDMALLTLDGQPANLSAYLGKTPLLMEVWATWCENCEALAPRIMAAKAKYGDKMKFLGIAVSFNQSPARVKAHMEKHGFDMETLYDKKGEADGIYGVKATSTIVVIDKSGKIVYAGAGAGQDIEAAVKKGLGI
ncbi:MAG: TlpA family protein disulfide reductase [Gemmatimonadetes bacterium]|nr:TlpA family protein disulfide reductase [Gemmatimonadota bacterium]